jgi:hypothetical protein
MRKGYKRRFYTGDLFEVGWNYEEVNFAAHYRFRYTKAKSPLLFSLKESECCGTAT